MELSTRQKQQMLAARIERARRMALRGDPIEYVSVMWPNVKLDWFQEDLIRSLFDPAISEVFVKGCTGPGKGFGAAVGINMWFDCYPESRIIITSSTHSHARSVMFSEVVAVRKMMSHKSFVNGIIRKESIEHTTKHYVAIVNPEDGTGESFSGQHGTATLFVFDEASSVSDVLYENSKKQARSILALSNPRTLSGWFRRGFEVQNPDETQTIQTTFGGRRLITVGATDCMNVKNKRLARPVAPYGGITIEGRDFKQGELIPEDLRVYTDLLIPGQIDYATYLDTMSNPDSRKRQIFGEGKFPSDDEELQVICGGWLGAHEQAWIEADGQIPVYCFGLDVGASASGDPSVLAAGGKDGLANLHAANHEDTMQVVEWVIHTCLRQYGIDIRSGMNPVAVDVSGLGKGVADRLMENGVDVVPIDGGAAAQVGKDRYANRRAEVYGELGRRLDPKGPFGDTPWPLCPTDPLLREELMAPEKRFKSDGIKFTLTPKDRYHGMIYAGDTIREKIGRSPDRADAVAYLYAAVRSMESIAPAVLSRPLLIVDEPDAYPEVEEVDPIREILDRFAQEDAMERVASGTVEYPSWF